MFFRNGLDVTSFHSIESYHLRGTPFSPGFSFFTKGEKENTPPFVKTNTPHPNGHSEFLNPASAQLVGDGDPILVLVEVTVVVVEVVADLLEHLYGGNVVLVDLDKEGLQRQIAIAYDSSNANSPYTTSSPTTPCSTRSPCGDPSYRQPSR